MMRREGVSRPAGLVVEGLVVRAVCLALLLVATEHVCPGAWARESGEELGPSDHLAAFLTLSKCADNPRSGSSLNVAHVGLDHFYGRVEAAQRAKNAPARGGNNNSSAADAGGLPQAIEELKVLVTQATRNKDTDVVCMSHETTRLASTESTNRVSAYRAPLDMLASDELLSLVYCLGPIPGSVPTKVSRIGAMGVFTTVPRIRLPFKQGARMFPTSHVCHPEHPFAYALPLPLDPFCVRTAHLTNAIEKWLHDAQIKQEQSAVVLKDWHAGHAIGHYLAVDRKTLGLGQCSTRSSSQTFRTFGAARFIPKRQNEVTHIDHVNYGLLEAEYRQQFPQRTLPDATERGKSGKDLGLDRSSEKFAGRKALREQYASDKAEIEEAVAKSPFRLMQMEFVAGKSMSITSMKTRSQARRDLPGTVVTEVLRPAEPPERPFSELIESKAVYTSPASASMAFNASQLDPLTVVIMSYPKSSSLDVLTKHIEAYQSCPWLLSHIVLVWNGNSTAGLPQSFWVEARKAADKGMSVRVVATRKNSLSNRFLPSVVRPSTRAVSFVDDDSYLRCRHVPLMVDGWEADPDRAVGWGAPEWRIRGNSLAYLSGVRDKVMVIPQGSVYHAAYLKLYEDPRLGDLRSFVDGHTVHPDDIALAALVNNVGRKTVKVLFHKVKEWCCESTGGGMSGSRFWGAWRSQALRWIVGYFGGFYRPDDTWHAFTDFGTVKGH